VGQIPVEEERRVLFLLRQAGPIRRGAAMSWSHSDADVAANVEEEGMCQLVDWLYANRYIVAKAKVVSSNLQQHEPLSKEQALALIPQLVKEFE